MLLQLMLLLLCCCGIGGGSQPTPDEQRRLLRTLQSGETSSGGQLQQNIQKADTAANPLAGLPALPKVHHSDGGCQVGNIPAPSVPCPFPVDSNSPLMFDYARITHAWPIQIALGGDCCPGGMRRDDYGNTIWDPIVLTKSLNKTEVVEATKLCAKANASITINFSPWAYFWGGQVGNNKNGTGPGNSTVRNRERPLATPWAADPTVEGPDEEMELRFFRTQLATISAWIKETNPAVHIGGILLDSESFLINFANQTQVRALQRKDDMMYNVSAEFCPPPLCTVDQYNRGTIVRDATMAKPDEGIPPDDAWTPWPGTSYTAKPQQKNTYDSYSTSLYTIPEIGYTRDAFTRTVSNAAQFGTPYVTPWLWLGGGCHRTVKEHSPGTTLCGDGWTYDLPYSWMIGLEINDPFYGDHPARFAPWHAARRVALFPMPFNIAGWTDGCPPEPMLGVTCRAGLRFNTSTGHVLNNVENSVLNSNGLKHFVACKPLYASANMRMLTISS